MKRGDYARDAIRKKIIEAFGSDYVDTVDKKIYVNQRDGSGGEILQFAISLTMPKTPITKEKGGSSTTATATATNETTSSIDMSDEDKRKVAELMKKLNIC